MRGQLKVLKSGRHPKTLLPIPPPVPLAVWESSKHTPPTVPPPTSIEQTTQPLNIHDDGTELTQAFIRRGRPTETQDDHLPPIKRLKNKLASRALQASSNKRKLEEFLSVAELADPDLIDFWNDDIEVSAESSDIRTSSQPTTHPDVEPKSRRPTS